MKDNKSLRDWIDFFKSAHRKDRVPESVEKPLKIAYELIRVDTLKKVHPEILTACELESSMYSEYNEIVKEIGRKEGKEEGIKEGEFNIAKRMIENTELTDVKISEFTGLSLLDVETLRK